MKNFYFLTLLLLIISKIYSQIIPPPSVNNWYFMNYSGNGVAQTYSRISDTAYEGNHSQSFYVSLPHGGATIDWVKNFGREFTKPRYINYKYAYKAGNWTVLDFKIRFYMKKENSLYYFDESTVYPDTALQWVGASNYSYMGTVPNFSEIVIRFYFMPATLGPSTNWAEVLLDELRLYYGIDSIIIIDRFGDPLTGVNESGGIVEQFRLYQNFPNPFNPTTTISFSLPIQSYVSLKIFDALGREVTTLVNELKEAGRHLVEFSSQESEISSGVYFYKLKAGNFIETKKMLIIK